MSDYPFFYMSLVVFFMRRLLLLTTSLLLSTSLFASDIVIKGAWVSEAPPMAKTLGGYMILKNLGKSERHLVAVSAASFDEVLLHRTVVEGGIAKMVHQHEVTVPAGGRIEFKPGDYHLMLMRPERRFVAGDHIDMILKFRNGEEKPVVYRVLKGMGGAMNHDHH
ncbi:MAG TPA: copper chaperone PCu(A)C [Ectothiorhodospiraceae bacterium]|nr:copper chaperone PCu(A)C [Ectothiorhodospiraceae bacterium]